MTTKHSLISPSNFERRMLCPGSLNAEKDLPETTSKYSEEGTLLHERTAMYIEYTNAKWVSTSGHILPQIDIGDLTIEQKTAVKDAASYFNSLKTRDARVIELEFHETTYDLGFIYPGMRGTADSVLIVDNRDSGIIEVHVVDYKFGRGVAVSAYQNYQLILYYLGAINNPEIKNYINGRETTVHLHIVQPFIKNSRWDLTKDEVLEIHNMQFYLDVVRACYAPNAKRIATKKACQFCKAKPTCSELAKTMPSYEVDMFELEDTEIAAIYDNRELIKLYLASIEDYIKNKLSNGGFEGYALVDKISNRKWNSDAETELSKILGEDAFENSSKLITISKAERILGKTSDIINKLTIKEVIGVEIIKVTQNRNN